MWLFAALSPVLSGSWITYEVVGKSYEGYFEAASPEAPLRQGVLDAAKANGGNVGRCVAMGYCFGGTAVLEFARSGADLKGFATFHGGLALPEGQDYSKTKGQVLIQHGSADTNITMEQFTKLANDLEAAHVPHEMITYGGAPPAWTVFGSGNYREDADRKSWRRLTEFLTDTLR